MIKSFKGKFAEALFDGKCPKGFPATMAKRARRKLGVIEAAAALRDLEVPPGNHLEVLKGDRKGQYSIRINEQWRVCFRWNKAEASDVEVVDYH